MLAGSFDDLDLQVETRRRTHALDLILRDRHREMVCFGFVLVQTPTPERGASELCRNDGEGTSIPCPLSRR
jgi:hypothetical protein